MLFGGAALYGWDVVRVHLALIEVKHEGIGIVGDKSACEFEHVILGEAAGVGLAHYFDVAIGGGGRGHLRVGFALGDDVYLKHNVIGTGSYSENLCGDGGKIAAAEGGP